MTSTTANGPRSRGARDGRRTPHRPRDRARHGAGRLGRGRALPRIASARRETVVHAIRALGRRAAALHADLADEARCAPCRPRRPRWAGDCIVNNASLFEYDSAATFSPPCWPRTCSANVAAPLLLAQALHALAGRRPGRGDQPARPETVQSQPGFFVVHAVEGGAAHRHHDAGPGAGAEAARGRRRARHHDGVGRPDRGRLCARHQARRWAARPPRRTSPTPSATRPARALTGTTLLVDGGQHLVPLNARRDVFN
jgi:hypothetical protein